MLVALVVGDRGSGKGQLITGYPQASVEAWLAEGFELSMLPKNPKRLPMPFWTGWYFLSFIGGGHGV